MLLRYLSLGMPEFFIGGSFYDIFLDMHKSFIVSTPPTHPPNPDDVYYIAVYSTFIVS